MAYCRFCGGKISETAIFCKNCGKNLAKEEPETKTQPETKTRPLTKKRSVSKTKPVTQTQPVTTKESPELDNSKNIKSYVPEPQTSTNSEILEIVKLVGDIKNTLLFYDDYLIIANIPKNMKERLSDVYTGELFGALAGSLGGGLGSFLGGKIGESYDKGQKKKFKEDLSLTPQEILDSDPGNLLIKYKDINKIKFEKKILRFPHILIITAVEEHKYSMAEEKYFKEIKSSIKSILKDKVTV